MEERSSYLVVGLLISFARFSGSVHAPYLTLFVSWFWFSSSWGHVKKVVRPEPGKIFLAISATFRTYKERCSVR